MQLAEGHCGGVPEVCKQGACASLLGGLSLLLLWLLLLNSSHRLLQSEGGHQESCLLHLHDSVCVNSKDKKGRQECHSLWFGTPGTWPTGQRLKCIALPARYDRIHGVLSSRT